MDANPSQEHYRKFLNFVSTDHRRERSQFHRRMFTVFFWCFLVPALISLAILILVKFHALPKSSRAYLEWLILIFPVSYSVYFLISDFIKEIPSVQNRKGMGSTLHQALKEGEWREQICESLSQEVQAGPQGWEWIVQSFRMDLKAFQYRNRYLTALSGAVFFLIMEGIDSINGPEDKVIWAKDPILGWVQASNSQFPEWVGLGLFLLLLYLSGSQAYHSLERYLNCAELMEFRPSVTKRD